MSVFELLKSLNFGGLAKWDGHGYIEVHLTDGGASVGSIAVRDWARAESWIYGEIARLRPGVQIARRARASGGVERAIRNGVSGTLQWSENFSFQIGSGSAWAPNWTETELLITAAIDRSRVPVRVS